VVLSGATRLAKAPVGSGEVFTALRSSGVLGRLRGLGVRHLEVHACEDNLLARPLDPALLGYVLDR
jgi:UDP-N-acetylglucosamine pyrophosphorylase